MTAVVIGWLPNAVRCLPIVVGWLPIVAGCLPIVVGWLLMVGDWVLRSGQNVQECDASKA